MDPIRLQFELDDKIRDDTSRQEEIARDLEARFLSLAVEKVTVKRERRRDATAVLAAIGVGILIVRDGKKLARSSKELLKEVIEIAKMAAQGWIEIKNILIGVGPKQVPLSQITDREIERMAAAEEPTS